MARVVLAQLVIAALAVTLVTRQLVRSPTTPVALKTAHPAAASGTSLPPTVKAPPSPATTTSVVPAVAPMAQLHAPSAIVSLAAPLTASQLKSIKAQRGVDAAEVVDVGTVGFAGAPAVTLGVDPGTFRDFTPSVTAASDQLWQYIASGSVASSFDMARDRKLTLGVDAAVAAVGGGATTRHWLGAFMSVGLPGVDLVVSRPTSGALGLAPNTGLVVSAPALDPLVLQKSIKAILPGASVVLMRPGLGLGTSGGGTGLVTTAQLSTALTAALSRVGKLYVWGATGPDSFDCSGLVGWSFAAAGVNLPRTAAQQALAGPAVPLNKIQPGDLLFWAWDPADPGFIDHVAIYLGGGKMIEAPFTGASVHVVAVENSHLVGAVRINPAVAARLGSPWQR